MDCVVGLYPHERGASQPLQLDIDLMFDTQPAGEQESFALTVDYAAVSAQAVFLLRSCRFRLLETAAHALARLLLAPPSPGERRAQVDEVRIQMRKPGALRGFATPSIALTRTAEWARFAGEEKAWGTVDVIHETRDAGIYRLNIAPGRGIPLHVHRAMRESEMVLTRGLQCQGEETPPGTVRRWPLGAAHRYDNPTDRWQSLLCVDMPRFMPDDEVQVEGEVADVPPEPPWGPMAGLEE